MTNYRSLACRSCWYRESASDVCSRHTTLSTSSFITATYTPAHSASSPMWQQFELHVPVTTSMPGWSVRRPVWCLSCRANARGSTDRQRSVMPIMSLHTPRSQDYYAPHSFIYSYSFIRLIDRAWFNVCTTADSFYRSDDPTNSVKALKEGG